MKDDSSIPSDFYGLFNFLFDRGTRPEVTPERQGPIWTPEKFARKCSVTKRTVNNWRRVEGRRTLPVRDVFSKIEEAFFGEVKKEDPYEGWRLRFREAYRREQRAKKQDGNKPHGDSPDTASVTIALVDDDRNILTSVSIPLEAEGYRIMTYTDGASALDGFKSSPPDLAILDIKMPRMDGVETLRRLRQKSDMPVIFLTSKDEEVDELLGLKVGADDFIRKPFSQRLLVERVKVLLRRSGKDGTAPGETDTARVLERGALRMDPERHTCTWKNEPVTLTVTEFLILQALATRPGVVKSRNALMDAAYDDQVYVDDRTIDSHIKRLREKFKQVEDSFDMIETLRGVGYRYRE